MRVAFLTTSTDPALGGVATFASDLLEALKETRDMKHDIIAYVDAELGPTPPHVTARVVDPPSGALPARAARRAARELARLHPALDVDPDGWQRRFAEDRIDLCWSAGPFLPVPDVPTMLTVFDLQHRVQPFFPEVSVGGEWARREEHHQRTLPRAAFVIVGTRTGGREVMRSYGIAPARLRVVPLPTPSFAVAAGAAFGNTNGVSVLPAELMSRGVRAPFLLYPAHMWAHKNHVAVLRALAIMEKEHGLRMDVVFTGADKGNRARVEAEIGALGLAGRAHLLGLVDRAALIALYRSAHALAFASFFGPDNLPPLEAMALGCPVIAADVAGAREQLGDAALRFRPTAPEELAAHAASLARDPTLRSSLVERGRLRAARFDAQRYVAASLAVLDELTALRTTWGRAGGAT